MIKRRAPSRASREIAETNDCDSDVNQSASVATTETLRVSLQENC